MLPTSEVMAKVSPLSPILNSCELRRLTKSPSHQVTKPLLSLVLRTEDVWQRYNQ